MQMEFKVILAILDSRVQLELQDPKDHQVIEELVAQLDSLVLLDLAEIQGSKETQDQRDRMDLSGRQDFRVLKVFEEIRVSLE